MNTFTVTYQQNLKLKTKTFQARSKKDLLKTIEEDPILAKNLIQIKQKQTIPKLLQNTQINFSFNDEQKILKLFEQLQTMLEANLTFNKSIYILLANQKNQNIKKLLEKLQYCIKNNLEFSKYLQSDNTLDNSSLVFLDLGIKNGNIKDAVTSLVTIKKESFESKKALKNTLRYPMVLVTALIVAIFLILNFVLPNFEHIFSNINTKLPFSTLVLLEFKTLVTNYWGYIVFIVLSIILGVSFLYKKFHYSFDKFLFYHGYLFRKLLRSYTFYKLFLSIYTIIKAKYKFQTALLNSQEIVTNQYIKSEITTIADKINKGTPIPDAFQSSKLFDDITIELLYTAEYSNNYETVLEDISTFYKKRFNESIKNFSSTLEPLLILLISFVVLWIILAVMVPVWDLSTSL